MSPQNKMLIAAAAAAALLAGPAHAQSGKKELVARALQLQQPGIELIARQLTEHPARLLVQQVAPLVQRAPADKRDTLAREIESDVRKYADESLPIVRERAVKLAPTTIGTLLEERFTEEELKQLIALLESPVNRKYQAMVPDMQRAIGEKIVAETRAEVEAKLRTLEQAVNKRILAAGVGGPPPSASAPARTGAAPAASNKK